MDIKENCGYDRFPKIAVRGRGDECFSGYESILAELKSRIPSGRFVVNIDTYPGVDDGELIPQIKKAFPDAVFIDMKDVFTEETVLKEQLRFNLTDDRVFGRMYFGDVSEFFDPGRACAAVRAAESAENTCIVYGFGSKALYGGDLLVYCDMARWEIQMRFRSGKLSNWLDDNAGEDALRLYKRGFFADWRALDRHKRARYGMMDYVLDTNNSAEPKMMTGAAFRRGLEIAASRPFRVKPYFDPGVWGGQWMKEKFDLDPSRKNYAWSFDCVPEENSLLMDVGGVTLETPSINLVFAKPVELLGDKVHARFGAEFPIRFDMLDTMRGGNLSLQCHPLTEYIQDAFGMHYTQDESYYLLDADESASPVVYLGRKTGVGREEFAAALRESEKTGSFDAQRYVNAFPAKKHDHFLIPGGTIHCSGANCMVLEISATPYIFTFKMWDWGRIGLDGRPRPIHVEHALANIQFNRDTEWVRKNLVGRVETISERPGVKEERTGLHEREFIETRRHWFTAPVEHDTTGGVNVLNLVEGEEAVVESPSGAFEPFTVHYAETFIVPAAVGRYVIRPAGPGADAPHATIKAYVRT